MHRTFLFNKTFPIQKANCVPYLPLRNTEPNRQYLEYFSSMILFNVIFCKWFLKLGFTSFALVIEKCAKRERHNVER